MTDQTPQTEAVWLALTDAIYEEVVQADAGEYVADLADIIRKYRPLIEAEATARGDAALSLERLDHEETREALAQARTEALDVEVLARAFDGHVWGWLDWTQEDNAPADRKVEALHSAADILATRYRAILAEETE